jgi:hypothetical protein
LTEIIGKVNPPSDKDNRQDATKEAASRPKGRPGRPPKGRRGRKKLPHATAEHRRQVLEKWNRAKGADVCREDFCKDNRIKVADLKRYQEWRRQRQGQ